MQANTILHQMPLGPLQTNCYLLGDAEQGQAVVIDPAWDGATILAQAEARRLRISAILLTHAHFDHVGGLARLKEATGAPLYLHLDAWPMLAQAPASAASFGLTMPAPPQPDHAVQDGQQIQVGKLGLQALYTPGHAPGHVCYYVPAFSLLFSGDALFQQSIGRTDLPGGDYDQLMASIWERLMVLPDETSVFSGHGPATTIGDERLRNPFLQP